MAVESPQVTAVTIEANEFPDLIDHYGLTGVPMTIVDEQLQVLGALPEDAFVPQVLGGRAPDSASGEEHTRP